MIEIESSLILEVVIKDKDTIGFSKIVSRGAV